LNNTLQDGGGASLQHSVIEAALDLAAIAPDYTSDDPMAIEIFWGPSCGNDRLSVLLYVQPDVQPNSEGLPIHAPGTLLLFGVASLIALRARSST